MSSSGSDIEALNLTLHESRAVLDHQIALLDDIDNKAMWTVRTSLLILGILASAAGVVGGEQLSSIPIHIKIILTIAGGLLFISAMMGISIYTSSDVRFGIGEDHRREVLSAPYGENEWVVILLDEYSTWIDEMRSETENNASVFLITQLVLATALLLLYIATGLIWISV